MPGRCCSLSGWMFFIYNDLQDAGTFPLYTYQPSLLGIFIFHVSSRKLITNVI